MSDGSGGSWQELIRAQNRTNELLGELRADVARVKQTVEGQSARLDDLRDSHAETGERLRSCELRIERLPMIERDLLNVQAVSANIADRVRALEMGGVKTDVVTGSTTKIGWAMLGAMIAAAVAAAAARMGVAG